MIALIPARSGSERIPNKNVRELNGHPLIAYAIASALKSRLFFWVVVSTDSRRYAEIARSYGATVVMRPERYALSGSPDIEWIKWTLGELSITEERFAILRPTSPFRSEQTIWRCLDAWDTQKYDSIRAVERVSQHPGKMWVVRDQALFPLLPLQPPEQPWHSSQMKTLPEVYVQNASLEMSTAEVLHRTSTISGWRMQAFITDAWEGFDLNTEYDWEIAEKAVRDGLAKLPEVIK